MCRDVFPRAKLLLCTWHAQRSWKEKLQELLAGEQRRADVFISIFQQLRRILYLDLTGQQRDHAAVAHDALSASIASIRQSCPAFAEYLQAHWAPIKGMPQD